MITNTRLLMVGIVSLGALNPAIAQSVLERVLASMPLQAAGASTLSVMTNIAETLPTAPSLQPRRLQPGDVVVIGYADSGAPVTATSDALGLTVTDLDAANIGAGVPPGFYPVGSTLFRLPAGTQYSLFSTDAEGARLAAAQELTESRIDGAITNTFNRIIPADLTEIASVALDVESRAAVGLIASTALGAVNSGEIVTALAVEYDLSTLGTRIDIAHARVEQGVNASVDAVQTSSTLALSATHESLGGSREAMTLALNVASNQMEVVGTVTNLVLAQSAAIGTITTTVLGAVNGGAVRSGGE